MVNKQYEEYKELVSKINNAQYRYDREEVLSTIKQRTHLSNNLEGSLSLFGVLERGALKILLDLLEVVKAIVAKENEREVARTLSIILLEHDRSERGGIKTIIEDILKNPPDGWELLVVKGDEVIVGEKRRKV